MSANRAVSIATLYLIIYTAMAAAGYAYPVVAPFYLASPLILLGTAYMVVKVDGDKYPELGEEEEWGYRDKSKNQLGLF